MIENPPIPDDVNHKNPQFFYEKLSANLKFNDEISKILLKNFLQEFEYEMQ